MSISSAESWNTAVLERNGSFLQSFEWGAFQEAFGRPVLRFSRGTFSGQAIVHALPLGLRYYYFPRGPVGAWAELEFDQWYAGFRSLAQKNRAAFLRIDPPREADEAILRRNRFFDTDRAVQPRKNLVLDLRESEDALLLKMHEKTRYNIRVAERHGVSVRFSDEEKDSARFFANLSETAERQNIRLHPNRYYQTMLDHIPALADTTPREGFGILTRRLYLALSNESVLASALVVYFGKRATYLHGGSTRLTINGSPKNVMAPYALHWAIIRDARNLGCLEYDFGGVDDSRWPGITRFKRGFGGRNEQYANAFEAPLGAVRYRCYKLVRRIIR